MSKISELDEITSLADDDFWEVVDKSDPSMSADGTNKRISKVNFEAGLTTVSNDPYGSAWENDLDGASRGALFDKFESVVATGTEPNNGTFDSTDLTAGILTITHGFTVDGTSSFVKVIIRNTSGENRDVLYYPTSGLESTSVDVDISPYEFELDVDTWTYEVSYGAGPKGDKGDTGEAGAGDVNGPGSSTDNALPRFDGTGGKTLQGSSVIVDDSDNISGVALLATTTLTVGGDTISGENTGDMSDAEVKTAYENNANTNALTDAEKTVLGNTSNTNSGDEVAANTTTPGIAEIAISSEINTGTDTGRTISPDSFAGSNFGIRYIEVLTVDYTTDVATGDGAAYVHIPDGLNGMNLVYVHAKVITAGTTGTTDIQIHNFTDTQDMLSTVLTIDSGETGSDTAATPAVIDTANDDVASNDLLRIDIDAISTTAPKGLIVTLGFQLP